MNQQNGNTIRTYTPLIAIAALVAAIFACNLPGSGDPDIDATLNAGVTQTLAAREAQETPVPATPTEPPEPLATDPLPEPTTTPPAPTASPTVGDPTRPNGALIHAPRRANPPILDGDLADWDALPHAIEQPVYQPENWSGPDDQRAVFAVSWDDEFLYLAVEITDDVHVQTETGETLFRGDSVELLLDANLHGDHADARLSADDFQLGFSPGGLEGAPDPHVYLWFPQSRAGQPEGVTFAGGTGDATGFRVEAAIPWALFPLSPTAGDLYGFAVSVSDNDTPDSAEQQSMISFVPTRRLTDPTTWGTLVLDD